jgi:hypothetical protein
MEAICSSETSAEIQRTTGRHVPDDTFHNHHCENLKSYKLASRLLISCKSALHDPSIDSKSNFIRMSVLDPCNFNGIWCDARFGSFCSVLSLF